MVALAARIALGLAGTPGIRSPSEAAVNLISQSLEHVYLPEPLCGSDVHNRLT